MGVGVGLTLFTIGLILALATDFSLSGIDIQMVGWILILVGVIQLLFTLLYLRPRRARLTVTERIDDAPPVYEVTQGETVVERPVRRDPGL
ncbi:hypothetical protein GCM10027589_57170 [Actinocorallia lasiicapitis]